MLFGTQKFVNILENNSQPCIDTSQVPSQYWSDKVVIRRCSDVDAVQHEIPRTALDDSAVCSLRTVLDDEQFTLGINCGLNEQLVAPNDLRMEIEAWGEPGKNAAAPRHPFLLKTKLTNEEPITTSPVQPWIQRLDPSQMEPQDSEGRHTFVETGALSTALEDPSDDRHDSALSYPFCRRIVRRYTGRLFAALIAGEPRHDRPAVVRAREEPSTLPREEK